MGTSVPTKQRKDPRTPEAPAKKVAGSEKAKIKDVAKDEEKKEEKSEAQKNSLVDKTQSTICELP